jgi:hypothetical protein
MLTNHWTIGEIFKNSSEVLDSNIDNTALYGGDSGVAAVTLSVAAIAMRCRDSDRSTVFTFTTFAKTRSSNHVQIVIVHYLHWFQNSVSSKKHSIENWMADCLVRHLFADFEWFGSGPTIHQLVHCLESGPSYTKSCEVVVEGQPQRGRPRAGPSAPTQARYRP